MKKVAFMSRLASCCAAAICEGRPSSNVNVTVVLGAACAALENARRPRAADRPTTQARTRVDRPRRGPPPRARLHVARHLAHYPSSCSESAAAPDSIDRANVRRESRAEASLQRGNWTRDPGMRRFGSNKRGRALPRRCRLRPSGHTAGGVSPTRDRGDGLSNVDWGKDACAGSVLESSRQWSRQCSQARRSSPMLHQQAAAQAERRRRAPNTSSSMTLPTPSPPSKPSSPPAEPSSTATPRSTSCSSAPTTPGSPSRFAARRASPASR